jgi:hypothetical protein
VRTPSNPIKYKFQKVALGNLILKYDAIHGALKVICDKNLNAISAIWALEGF